MSYIVGVPTLNRYDLLDECIESIWSGSIVPSQVVVIDNGGNYHTKCDKVQIIKPAENIGVAASWNLLHTFSQHIVICNDDVVFEKDSLESLLATEGELVVPNGKIGWSCFKQSNNLWDAVGLYDEMFWPAYFEDNDYRYRMKLKGIAVTHANHDGISHHIASSGGKGERSVSWYRNRDYYIRKWGGEPYFEIYTIPFNRRKIGGKSGNF